MRVLFVNRLIPAAICLGLVVLTMFGVLTRAAAQGSIGIFVNTPADWPIHATIRIDGVLLSGRGHVGGSQDGSATFGSVDIAVLPPAEGTSRNFDIVWNEYHTGRSWRADFSIPHPDLPLHVGSGDLDLIFLFGKHGRFALLSRSQMWLDLIDANTTTFQAAARANPSLVVPVQLVRFCGKRDTAEDAAFAAYLAGFDLVPELRPDPEIAALGDADTPACDPEEWEAGE